MKAERQLLFGFIPLSESIKYTEIRVEKMFMLNTLVKIAIVVGTIIILIKAAPEIKKAAKAITDNRQEEDLLRREEAKNAEETGKINAALSQFLDQLIPPKCSDCGQPIPPEDLRPVCYCSFCGKKTVIKESLLKDIIRYANDQQSRVLELQKLQQSRRQNTLKLVSIFAILLIFLAVIGVGLCFLWKRW